MFPAPLPSTLRESLYVDVYILDIHSCMLLSYLWRSCVAEMAVIDVRDYVSMALESLVVFRPFCNGGTVHIRSVG